jgi:hypothetical protein
MRRTSEAGDAASGAEPIRDSFAGFFCRKNGIDDPSGYGFWDTAPSPGIELHS